MQIAIAPRPESLSGKLVYLAAAFGPFSTVPQIVEIYSEKNAAGVSLVSWSAFLVMSVIWLFHGVSTRDRPLILSNLLWLIGEAIIIVGAIRYDVDFL